jgi:TrmH family RNA methyltransferase
MEEDMTGEVTIVSRQNERIREAKRLVQKKYRDQTGRFLVEGVRLVEEALEASLAEQLFFTERLLNSDRGKALIHRAHRQGLEVFSCSEAVLDELTDTVHAQGVAAIARKPSWPAPAEGLLVIADEIQDPGNMGTLLRTAVAVGVQGLLAVKGSVDLYSPKVVRASMGAVFQLPHWMAERRDILDLLQSRGISIAVTQLEDAENFWDVAYPPSVAVVIGNEARGVHPSFRERAAFAVRIPLVGKVESLNASVAAGVLLYEILRQHRCSVEDSVL